MYVCMYVCMYVRTYVRTYVCMYVCGNLRTDKLVEFLGFNLVQMVKKFRIGILNFGTNRLY